VSTVLKNPFHFNHNILVVAFFSNQPKTLEEFMINARSIYDIANKRNPQSFFEVQL